MLTDIYSDSHIRIKHDTELSILIVYWVGQQTEDSVKEGCQRVHEAMVQHQSFYILNDNSHVLGDWSTASEWVAKVCFPAMTVAGLKRIAWIDGLLDLPKASIQQTLSHCDLNAIEIGTFTNHTAALAWLRL